MFNEAKKDVHEIKESIKKTVSEIDKNVEIQNKKVSVWISWLMANSLCHGDLNMTSADNLWRHSRKITDDIYKYETKLEKLRSELDGQNLKLDHFQKIFTDVQILHERNSEAFQMLQDSGCGFLGINQYLQITFS